MTGTGGHGETTARSAGDVAREMVRLLEAADTEGLMALYAEDAVVRHPLSGEVAGREAIGASEQALFDAFSDIAVETRGVYAESARVAVEVVIRATHSGPLDLGDGNSLPATGTRIELPSVWCLDLDGEGRIAEERDYLDPAELMRQLGVD